MHGQQNIEICEAKQAKQVQGVSNMTGTDFF